MPTTSAWSATFSLVRGTFDNIEVTERPTRSIHAGLVR